VLRQLEAIERRNPTVVIASPTHPADVLRAWESGAFSYIIRPFSADEIHGKILHALAWDTRMRQLRKRHKDVQLRYARLTPRESEIAQLVADGESTSEIATNLDIGVRTVETHRRSVLDKLNVQSPTELVSLLLQHRLDNSTLSAM
jgi:DNA-binding NarL/FixJ family response regulator